MLISPKIILYGVLAVGIGGGTLYIKHVFNENARLEVELKESNLSRDTAVASLGLYQENNERQVKIITEYQGKLDEKQNINSALERDVAANRKQLRIKGAMCAASSSSANPSTTETTPILTPELRRNIFYNRSGIITLEENYALCLKILDEDRRQKNASTK